MTGFLCLRICDHARDFSAGLGHFYSCVEQVHDSSFRAIGVDLSLDPLACEVLSMRKSLSWQSS